MQLNATKLVVFLFAVGTILSASTASSVETESSPESNLARGLFQLAVFNCDETRLLTATGKIAQLWDLKSGAMLQQFEGHAAHIHSVCFSPDERQVLTGAGKAVEHGRDDPTVRVWDVSTGNLVKVMTTVGKELVDDIGTSGSFYVMTARYSPDGQRILTVLNSRTAIPDAAVLWNLKTKEIDLVLSSISTNSGTMLIQEPVQFSPDGNWLSGFVNKSSQIVIWNARTGDAHWRFNASDPPNPNEEQGRFGLEAQWSPSGKYFLAVSGDRTVRVWDVSTGREIQRLQGHENRILVAQFFAKEKQIITASDDGTVRQWELQSGEQLQRWDYPGPVQELSVSPEGHLIVTRHLQRDESYFRSRWFAEIRNLKTGESIREWESPPLWRAENEPLNAFGASIMSPSGRLVLTTVWTDGEVEVALVDAETGIVRRTY